MNLLHICDELPASVTPDVSVAAAIGLMLDRRVGAVAVMDGERRVAGIFTERDVLSKVALSGRKPAEMRVEEVMTRPVSLATLATTPGEALSAMVEGHFRHLPIVDADGRLLGILSIRNLLQARIEELAHELDTTEQYANDSPGG